MKIREDQLNVEFLEGLGRVASDLLRNNSFQELAGKFGFALAFEREPAFAIESDLISCLSSKGLSVGSWSREPADISVAFFEQNDSGLAALIKCIVFLSNGSGILLELIATSSENGTFVTIEDIAGVA